MRLLADVHLRRFLGAQSIGQLGDAIAMIVTAELVASRLAAGASAAELGRLVAVTTVSGLLGLPVVALLADRVGRKHMLMFGTGSRAALLVLTAVFVGVGCEALAFFAIGLLLAVGKAISATRTAALSHLVHPSAMVAADALSAQIAMVACLVGAGIGAAMLQVSVVAVLVVAATLNALGAVAFRGLQDHRCGVAPVRRPAAGGTRAAQRTPSAWHVPEIRRTIAVTAAHRLLFGVVFATFVLIAGARRGPVASGYASAMAMSSVAGLAATLTAPMLSARVRPRLLTATALVAAGAAAAIAWAAGTPSALLAAVVVVGWSFHNTRLVADAVLQTSVVDDARDRTIALHDAVCSAAFVCGVLAAIAARHGSISILLPVGVAYLALASLHLPCTRTSPARNLAFIEC